MDKFKNKYRIPSARLLNWDYRNNGAYFITICTANREPYFGNIKNGIMRLNEIGQFAERFWSDIPEHFPFVELGNFVIMPNHTHGILIINNPENEGANNITQPLQDIRQTLPDTLQTLQDIVQTLPDTAQTSQDIAQPLQDIVQTLPDTPQTLQDTAHSLPDIVQTLPETPQTLQDTAHSLPDIVQTLQDTAHSLPDIVQTLQCNVSAASAASAAPAKNEQMAKISPKPGSISTIIRSYKSVVSKNARKIHADFGWQTRFHDHIIRDSKSFENIQNYIQNNPSNWGKDKFHG